MDNATTDTSPIAERVFRCEDGQTLVEYALILTFVSIVAIGLTPLGLWVVLRLGEVVGAL